jgi:ADP-ribose pyrophosphatase
MKIIKVEKVVGSNFLNLYDTHYQDKTGKDKHWLWVGRPNERKAVIIIAEVENKLAIIREFRVPLSGYEWGFPAGLIDGDEDAEVTVRRELKEETGLEVKEIKCISPFVYNSAGITNESIAVAYVTAEGDISKEHLESSEEIETFLMNQEGVKELLEIKGNMFGAKAWIIMNQFARIGRVL